jgi:hypothetical protein
MAVTRIRLIQVRYVASDPADTERRRRTLLELQVQSILLAAQASKAKRAAEKPKKGGKGD